MILRPYQQQAVEAAYRYLREHDGNPVIVLPTGAGKSIVLAQIVRDAVTLWNGRVLLLTHVRELIEQNADKIRRLCPELKVGVYSAGLRKRDTSHSVICAGIQSVYERACELGSFDLILVDEAHLISARDDSMYGQFLADMQVINPDHRVIGLTATPYRLDSGSICGPDLMFDAICIEVGIRQLIADGFLSSLVTKAGEARADTGSLHVRAGEFVASEVEAVMDQDTLVEAACAEIVELTKDRQSVLIFSAGVNHGQHIQRVLGERHEVECGFVSGDTPASERDELLARFRREPSDGLFERQPLKYLCNGQVLTTGFDAPNVDCVVLLRPTMSPGLYYQMVGRGFRLHPGKQNCLVLDYGGNVLRHGPVDQLQVVEKRGNGDGPAPAKECPNCRALIAPAYSICPQCGHEFPPPERKKHESQATNAGVLSGQVTDTEFEVRDVLYSVHTKKGAADDAPKTLRVDYRLGLDYWVSEWICFEHTGWPRRKAEKWWQERSPDPPPDTAAEGVDLAEAGRVANPESVTVRSIAGEKFDRIIGCELGPLPDPSPIWQPDDLADVPF
ncbi:type I restriction enzyme EcoKI subunit R [Maioricimonas rarisocia]|uniref:Type I restriction enzyme EcoKI subunit R n=1 Tax=Maioricimonas rarisocia TaxID=2528026 RepID=A0A517ZB27_9PLAN|nr:DEAD/DEAH box helicase [Maioricimonas rarisocia]QDU39703.1 type I restriction enzyme EcoKI subunit R [Maioricimonas rarisocia]